MALSCEAMSDSSSMGSGVTWLATCDDFGTAIPDRRARFRSAVKSGSSWQAVVSSLLCDPTNDLDHPLWYCQERGVARLDSYDVLVTADSYEIGLILSREGNVILTKDIGLWNRHLLVNELWEAVPVHVAMRLHHRGPYLFDFLFWEVIEKGWLGAVEQVYDAVLWPASTTRISSPLCFHRTHLDVMKFL